MANKNEYELSFTAKEVDERLKRVVFYNAAREELAETLGIEGATPTNVTSEVVWGLYDALTAKYPGRVQKKEVHNNDGTFTNYEYVVSTGDYNKVAGAYSAIDDIRKPKYLVACGIHGWEKASILSTYRLFRDIVTGHNIPAHFKEGCVIHFLPIGNPWSLDNTKRDNANNVNINRNFDWNWGVDVQADKQAYIGTSGNSEQETQAIANWLAANSKAELFLDCHNISPAENEIVTFIGLTDSEEYDQRKRIAMRGVDRAVQFWKDAIGYADSTIFRNSAHNKEGGLAIFYASEVLGIPSLCLELSARPTGTETTSQNLEPETIAVAAEAIGNVLLEFYEQYTMSEVMEEMSTINAKIDKALSFHVETGVIDLKEAKTGGLNFDGCSLNPKIFVLEPDREIIGDDGKTTYERILASKEQVFFGGVGQMLVHFLPKETDGSSPMCPYYYYYLAMMANTSTTSTENWELKAHTSTFRSDGAQLIIGGPKYLPGLYNWTAYYWND